MSLPSPSKGRIIIGEDLAEIAFLMFRALEAAGYEVTVAADGEECLRIARETLPDLITLDIMMPKMHGFDVLRALREDPKTRNIGVIMCSGKDYHTDRVQSEQLGAVDYLTKPIPAALLVERVEIFFGRRSSAIAPLESAATEVRAERFHCTLDRSRPHLELWGTRGSTPTVGGRFQRHGGNTSCMSLTFGDEVIIFDAGSGIRDLGLRLAAGRPRKLHLFITHPHWDHIQGFPFFTPAYISGFEITVYGAKGFGKDLESIFRGQLDRDYFPVQMDDMKSTLQFRHLTDEAIEIGGARITWVFAQHPGATVGYKVEVAQRKIAWVPDNEFLQGYEGPPTLGLSDPRVVTYAQIIAFLSDVDLLVHEAQYLPEEYATRVGWGHSSVSNACLLMKLAGVRRWIVTHHDPMHDDAFLETKLSLTRQLLETIGHQTQVAHGYDGMTEYL
ncbi:MAG: response regulator [Opitutus sp.]|nr:response regulator [Opitutus sp.]